MTLDKTKTHFFFHLMGALLLLAGIGAAVSARMLWRILQESEINPLLADSLLIGTLVCGLVYMVGSAAAGISLYFKRFPGSWFTACMVVPLLAFMIAGFYKPEPFSRVTDLSDRVSEYMKQWEADHPGQTNSHFNRNDGLLDAPPDLELVGIYQLTDNSPAAAKLRKMGYQTLEGIVELKQDRTFTAHGIPGCCVHGYDEITYPRTGGIYSFSGSWLVVKKDEIYDIEFTITSITEHTGLKIEDEQLRQMRKPPKYLLVSLIRGNPIDLGFNLFDGDFWPVPFQKIQEKTASESP